MATFLVTMTLEMPDDDMHESDVEMELRNAVATMAQVVSVKVFQAR